MFEPNSVYAKIAYDAILLYLKAKTKLNKSESEIPDALKLKLGCYVTIFDDEGNIIGKYGNTEPKNDYLFHEIIENAINASQDTTHAGPLKENQLNNISIQVDVLSQPKQIDDVKFLKPHKHGIILTRENGEKEVIFPESDGIENLEQMLKMVREKAGVSGDEDLKKLNLQHFTTTKYK
jgi:AMMECR1 domain-containing protein